MSKSVLYDLEIMHGAKMAEKCGVMIPKLFSAENIEADAVKDKCVMYDLTDKAKILITGKECYNFASFISTKIIMKNKITKTLILDDEANIVDIVKIYYISETEILVVIGLTSYEETIKYIKKKAELYDVEIKSLHNELYQIALMGQRSKEIMEKFLQSEYQNKYNVSSLTPGDYIINRNDDLKILYHENRLALTYGIMASKDEIIRIYKILSMNPNVLLGGTDSYNVLRKRARRLEYGVDIDRTINPYEASLEALVDYSHDFISRDKLLKLSIFPPTKRFVGIEFNAKNIYDNTFDIYYYGNVVGRVTSVCHETSIKCIGVGFIDTEILALLHSLDTSLTVKVGNEFVSVEVVEV